jgi:hippurate hydrolase
VSALVVAADELAGELRELRHALHRHPELGLDLPTTQGVVADALSGLDVEIETGRACTSLTAVIRGGACATSDAERPVVLLRADMDALPVHEATGEDFESVVPGQMHACGHDLHTAMLVGGARMLASRQAELPGDVVLMFQPGEELYDGAAVMIEEGVLDAAGRRPDAAWALHVQSAAIPPLGIFGSLPGPMMSACSELHVTVHGAGGHASAPHLANDPIPAACEMVVGLQTVLSRSISALRPVVVTVGEIHAGTKPSVISPEARFGATVRCFDEAVAKDIERELTRYCRAVAEAHGLTATVEFVDQYPVTVNDGDAVRQAEAVVADLFPDRWLSMAEPFTGSEDFSRVLQAVPGAMIFLGACPPEVDPVTAPNNHSPYARFSDEALAPGAAMYAALAIASLRRAQVGA